MAHTLATRALGEQHLAPHKELLEGVPIAIGDSVDTMQNQLNQDGNALAADAAKTIGDVLGRMAKR